MDERPSAKGDLRMKQSIAQISGFEKMKLKRKSRRSCEETEQWSEAGYRKIKRVKKHGQLEA